MLDEVTKKNKDLKAEELKESFDKENIQARANQQNISKETGEIIIPANNNARKRKKPQGGFQSTSTSVYAAEVAPEKVLEIRKEKNDAEVQQMKNSNKLKRSLSVNELDVKNLPFPQKVAVYAYDIHNYLKSIEVKAKRINKLKFPFF